MSFSEEVLLSGKYIYSTSGGPGFSTDIAVTASGVESRNKNRSIARGTWQLGERTWPRADIDDIVEFFRARGGRWQGFRWKDWLDFEVTTANGILNSDGIGDGKPTKQLYKTYTSGSQTDTRKIVKPVSGTVKIYRNDTLQTAGTAASDYALDTTTGIVTFVPDSSILISSVTAADPGVVTTSTDHGFTTGDVIYFRDMVGMTDLNKTVATITVLTDTTFSIGIDTSDFTAGTGGHAQKFAQPADALTWSGEFDVPVRFDSDKLDARFDAYRESDKQAIFYLSSLPLVELSPDEIS